MQGPTSGASSPPVRELGRRLHQAEGSRGDGWKDKGMQWEESGSVSFLLGKLVYY